MFCSRISNALGYMEHSVVQVVAWRIVRRQSSKNNALVHTQQEVRNWRKRRTIYGCGVPATCCKKALLGATIEKGAAEVTVQDISERAMVNRSTFYRHYLGKYDLLSHYMQDLYAQVPVPERLPSPGDGRDQDPDHAPDWLVGILQHVKQNTEFYRVMLGKQGDPAFCAEGFRQFIERQFRQMVDGDGLVPDPTRPPIDLSVSYISHAAIGVIMWWLENGQPHEPEQIAAWLYHLSRITISFAAGWRSGK
jgi:AcrR family transcriptional regulator